MPGRLRPLRPDRTYHPDLSDLASVRVTKPSVRRDRQARGPILSAKSVIAMHFATVLGSPVTVLVPVSRIDVIWRPCELICASVDGATPCLLMEGSYARPATGGLS